MVEEIPLEEAGMVKALGHLVLKVRELDRAVAFYRDVLGLREVARYGGRMVFFTAPGSQNHHDLAILALGRHAPRPAEDAVGLYHVAFKVGDSLDELRQVKARLEARGVRIQGVSDHAVSQSLYLEDPDGNGVELYVDADPAIWREHPEAVATVRPLAL